MPVRPQITHCCLGLLVVLTASCNHHAAAPAPVAGKVCYQGRPVHSGTIVFAPDTAHGTTGLPICAAIGADGTYQLTGGTVAGIPAGFYRVTVTVVEPAPAVRGAGLREPRSLLPDKYRDPERSDLACEVKAGKENTINFNLD